MRTFFICCLALFTAVSAHAEPPTPVNNPNFSFPSSLWAPASARSAAQSMTDRWMADEPFDNPAIAPQPSISVSPLLLRVSRQDLRADSRNFDDEPAFLDGAGGWAGAPIGRFAVAVYLHQPVIRLENNAYENGTRGGPTPPAIVQSNFSNSEVRAGVATSVGLGAVRLGVAGEWTRRQDEYFYSEQSGSPGAGDRHATYEGDALGGQAGLRAAFDDGWTRGLSIGAAVRFVPEIPLTGIQTLEILSDTSTTAIDVTRESGWQGGLSARYALGQTFSVLGSFGVQTPQEWRGWDVTAGRHVAWAFAGEYLDVREPWSFRFGFGRETQQDAPEPSANMFALGFGWRSESLTLDFGVLRRSLARPDHPTSFDDRILATVTVGI